MTDDMPPPPPPQFAVHDEPPMPNRKATTALGLGIAALLCMPLLTVVLAPATWIVGTMAWREIDARPDRYTNRKMATIGMALAGVAAAVSVVFMLAR